MRVAEICPTCATYINASCIIYDGSYLANINASPLDSLDMILAGINTAIPPLSGAGAPTAIPTYIGQYYINTLVPELYVGLSTTVANWGLVSTIATTTTTTSTSTSTTTTTTTTP